MTIRTLEQLDERLNRYPPTVRAQMEALMDPELAGSLWESVARYADWRIEDALYDPDAPAPPPVPPRARRRRTGTVVPAALVGGDDPLLSIEPAIYVEALTGIEVPPNGVIRCPLHDERTPSFKAYPDPERGWYCFGCNAGGSIYDFGAAWWGIEPRGRGYHELRERLEAELVPALRRAAA